jgi:hypothetical protein
METHVLIEQLEDVQHRLRNTRYELDDRQIELFRLQSDLYLEYRRSGEKMTEKTIESKIALHDEVIKRQNDIRDLKQDVSALYDERDILKMRIGFVLQDNAE